MMMTGIKKQLEYFETMKLHQSFNLHLWVGEVILKVVR